MDGFRVFFFRKKRPGFGIGEGRGTTRRRPEPCDPPRWLGPTPGWASCTCATPAAAQRCPCGLVSAPTFRPHSAGGNAAGAGGRGRCLCREAAWIGSMNLCSCDLRSGVVRGGAWVRIPQVWNLRHCSLPALARFSCAGGRQKVRSPDCRKAATAVLCTEGAWRHQCPGFCASPCISPPFGLTLNRQAPCWFNDGLCFPSRGAD